MKSQLILPVSRGHFISFVILPNDGRVPCYMVLILEPLDSKLVSLVSLSLALANIWAETHATRKFARNW